ncbi:MAG: hypothetical protein ACK46X_09190 [Candidatus Sericytochromatia bacterium]
MADTILSLFDVSAKLGVSPSAIKKRVASLNLPVERGARGKLLFNRESYALLCQADELLKAGHGFEECRRQLGLDGASVVIEPETEAEAETVEAAEAPAPEPTVVDVPAPQPVALEAIVEAAPVAEAPAPEHEVSTAPAEPQPVAAAPAPAAVDHARSLPAPVFIQLGRRKPSESVRMRMIEHQPTPTPMPTATHAPEAPAPAPEPRVEPMPYIPTPAAVTVPILDPDLLARIDGALKLIEDKDKQNQMLQSKLLVAYDEMTKLSATAAAFQERSMNLQHEVQKLQGEIRLLTAPPQTKPWWKFWA